MTTSIPTPTDPTPTDAATPTDGAVAAVTEVAADGELTLTVTDDGIARVTLNRPDAGNALTMGQRDALLTWFARFNADPSVRVVVLGSTGRFFCTGADLRQQRSAGPRPDGVPEKLVGDIRRAMTTGGINVVHAILDCEKPVIAAVQGTAAGIGAHLVFACDLVVAADNAKFIEIFARRGLAVDGLGTWLLPRLVGLARARELVLLAEDIPATRAAEIGLIARTVPAEELAATVDDLATRLAAGPTRAHSANKWLLNRSLDVDRHTLAQEEAWVVEALSYTEDADEGVRSFVERRPTRFRGF
ncbi:2-(1,2-epoxy-1,2-dihydrophenyl)acetyl-CoA isomerase [Parafrankia irregularis]|uniref:2-(1,2-epoxy-1,2-dihydrophenyl)acetyl-CoA isomerase n=1 Tax=Parafrankia irregularis TaxID=795642 RepID=A0A0S4QHL1_9ACTN|nr:MULTISPECIES: enoyl-CoA hydratase-related protein [Parafrankia]CUU54915.1 2-(1,2-epoxy-1,2-dihydrophenyl)acetyl-CoA isomerase [Parafrankia irregularis]